MKVNKIIPFLFATFLSMLSLAGFSGGDLYLIKDGNSDYVIVIPEKSKKIEKRAAEELQFYLREVSGTELPIVTDKGDPGDKMVMIGKNSYLKELGIKPDLKKLDEDGYHILTHNNHLIIAGGIKKGTLYGVYRFLEDYLGCRMYTPEVQFIPSLKEIFIPEIDLVSNPAFDMRTLYFPAMHSQKFSDWHGIDSHKDRIKLWGSFVHTFKDLVPAGDYFETNPEYFSEVRGNRIDYGQLCLSNPDVPSLLISGLKPIVKKRRVSEYFSVSQNDNYFACQCDACSTLIDKYDSQSGLILEVVNQVADSFPDKKISTLAYQYSRAAPKGIKPADNVNIMLCTIECNRSLPISSDPVSESFRDDMDDWRKLTDDILLWDYVVQFRNYISPFPNLRVLQPNLQYFRDKEVGMMFQQGSGHERSEFSELRSYLIAKLLWDPDRDINVLINDFLYGFYGQAAPYIREYIDLLHDAMEESGNELSIYGFPYDGFSSYLSPEMIRQYEMIFDKAKASVENDYTHLERVIEASLPLEYAICDISVKNPYGEYSYFLEKDGKREVNPEMVRRLREFVETADAAGIKQLREGGMPPSNYYERVMSFVSSGVYFNKSLGMPVTLSDTASSKYSNGDPGILTDGLRGLADHNYNWLGFEGNDMEAVIDLGEVQNISLISSRFLQWNRIWTFLPEEVAYYSSTDGIDFDLIDILDHQIPTDARGIIPADFNFTPDDLKARFIKVIAKSIKTCPEWHIGAGEPAWIFVDEIVVE